MKAIELDIVQSYIDKFANGEVYVHLETTNGAYAKAFNPQAYNVGAYIRNAKLIYSRGKIVQDEDSFRVGLKHEVGWIYAEGLTDYEITEKDQLLLAGHDREGRLMVALQISRIPFSN